MPKIVNQSIELKYFTEVTIGGGITKLLWHD